MLDLVFLLIGLGVFIGFFSQTINGFSAALFAVPIMLFALTVQESMAIMAILLLVFSMVFIPKNWKHIDKKVVLGIAITNIIGFLIGSYILIKAGSGILSKALGVFILFYVGYSFIKNKKIESFKKLGPVFGFFGGIFSALFASGGPLIATYVNNKLNHKDAIRATIIGIFAISNVLRIPIFAYNGLFTQQIILNAIYALPFFFLALYLGQKLYNKLNDKWFNYAIMFTLMIAAISLLLYR